MDDVDHAQLVATILIQDHIATVNFLPDNPLAIPPDLGIPVGRLCECLTGIEQFIGKAFGADDVITRNIVQNCLKIAICVTSQSNDQSV